VADIPTPPLDIDQMLTSVMGQVAQNAERQMHDELEALKEANDTRDAMQAFMDSLRQRVADGDTGTSAPGTTAPGWGGGVSSLLPWLAMIVVAGIAGTAIGLTGVLGVPVEQVTVLQSSASVITIAPTYACPGGPQVGQLRGGDHVVAVQRSDDSSYVGVRNPYNVGDVLWLETSVLVVDAGQPAVAGLPVGSCPTAAIQYGTPEPVAPTDPDPAPNPNPPAPTPDTTPPSIGKPVATPGNCYVLVTVSAADNIGVTSVTLSWSGPTVGSAAMQPQGGGSWRYEQGDPGWFFHDGNHNFVAVARDAAGNTVQSGSATAYLQCLI
jgi:hypothetical protein